MAMDKTVLGTAIAERLAPIDAPMDFKVKVTEVWMAVADEVIKHIETEGGFYGTSAEMTIDVVVNRIGVGTATIRGSLNPPPGG